MIDLAAAQRAVYEALREAAGAPCFVRLCMDHGALWVSDLPRRTDRLAPALAALETLGVKQRTGPGDGSVEAGLDSGELAREAGQAARLIRPPCRERRRCIPPMPCAACL